MERYWDKRKEFPSEVTSTEVASSDEESDHDVGTIRPSSPAPSSPAPSSPVNSTENPDIIYARYRAQMAANHHLAFPGGKRSYVLGIKACHQSIPRRWICVIIGQYVSKFLLLNFICLLNIQEHAYKYPTVARIALDFLPVMASSVPSEQLFSSSGETADDQHSRLGPIRFEEAQVMKWHWRQGAVDFAKANQQAVDNVDLSEFEGLLLRDEADAELDKLCGTEIVPCNTATDVYS